MLITTDSTTRRRFGGGGGGGAEHGQAPTGVGGAGGGGHGGWGSPSIPANGTPAPPKLMDQLASSSTETPIIWMVNLDMKVVVAAVAVVDTPIAHPMVVEEVEEYVSFSLP